MNIAIWCLVNFLDGLFTSLIYVYCGYDSRIEANPIAAYLLDEYELPGLIVFKLIGTLIVIGLLEASKMDSKKWIYLFGNIYIGLAALLGMCLWFFVC